MICFYIPHIVSEHLFTPVLKPRMCSLTVFAAEGAVELHLLANDINFQTGSDPVELSVKEELRRIFLHCYLN